MRKASERRGTVIRFPYAEPAATPSPSLAPEEPLGREAFRALDRMSEATLAPFTRGVSPAALMLASFDWLLHLAVAPGKRMELVDKAARKNARFLSHVAATALGQDAPPCIEPLPGDHRFRAEAWGSPPWNLWSQGFLLTQQWWHNVTREVPGVSPHHEEVVSFVARQLLDIVSPSNNPALNPEVLERTRESGGANFVTGFSNWLEDASRLATGRPPVGSDAFVPGREVAVTPGKVVFRNHLIELLQYEPTTETVRAEPVLIVPAWIMKYYILDLSPHNSLIRYLVEHGHTVFCVSWRNPGAEDRDLTLDDYRRLGVMAALDAIEAIVPERKVHAAGYCLGGTLLAATAAAMATRGDHRLASLTLLAAQTDFTEPGELALFIDHSELHFLDSMMWNRGYLSTDQMAGAFQLLRSNDLVWSRLVREYLMGERAAMTDLMAWNADATRMPYKMHSEYLRRLYIDNELASGRFMVEGRPAVIQNIRAPMFVVGTEADHVAPWRSVFKIHYLADTDVTFALASGGHNAGIVSEPGHRNRHYRLATKHANEMCVSPEEWAAALEPTAGSWWTAWERWLTRHSSEARVKPPGFGGEGARRRMDDAPGTYVLQR